MQNPKEIVVHKCFAIITQSKYLAPQIIKSISHPR